MVPKVKAFIQGYQRNIMAQQWPVPKKLLLLIVFILIIGLLFFSLTAQDFLSFSSGSKPVKLKYMPASFSDRVRPKHVMPLGEEWLLKAVDRLPFNVMTPSAILLEDLYFQPNFAINVLYNEKILIQPFQPCVEVHELLLIVPSPPGETEMRKAIRETWGSVSRSWPWPHRKVTMKIKVVFVLGVNGPPDSGNHNASSSVSENIDLNKQKYYIHKIHALHSQTKDTKEGNSDSKMDYLVERKQNEREQLKEILKENENYNDILQFNMTDSYANLTRKLILALKWANATCSNVKYVMKVDQDVFVNIPLLATFLKHYGEKNSIYGKLYPNAWVEREGRWAVSSKDLPIPRYPIYAAGNAYIMTTDAMSRILEMCPHFPYIPIEDAFITGILASVCKVDRVNVAGFTNWIENKTHACEFVNDRRYIGNRMTARDHRVTWRILTDDGKELCDV